MGRGLEEKKRVSCLYFPTLSPGARGEATSVVSLHLDTGGTKLMSESKRDVLLNVADKNYDEGGGDNLMENKNVVGTTTTR